MNAKSTIFCFLFLFFLIKKYFQTLLGYLRFQAIAIPPSDSEQSPLLLKSAPVLQAKNFAETLEYT